MGKAFGTILKNGCVIFTGITIVIYGVGAILSDADKAFIPTFQWVFLFFVFSLLLSGANRLIHLEQIALSLRMLLHFFATAALYIVAVVLCGGLYKNGTTLLMSVILFIVGYIIFAVLYSIKMHKRQHAGRKKEAYKSVFH